MSNDNKMYTVIEALKELEKAKAKGDPSVTLYGIHANCVQRVKELSPYKVDTTTFRDKHNQHRPCATFTFK